MKKKLEELKAKLAALKSRIEADDKDAIAEGEKLRGEIETVQAEIAQAEKKAALLSMIGSKSGEDDDTDGAPARSLGEHFVRHLKAHPVGKGQRFDVAAKAYNDPLAVGTIASPQVPRALVTDIDRNIVQEVLP